MEVIASKYLILMLIVVNITSGNSSSSKKFPSFQGQRKLVLKGIEVKKHLERSNPLSILGHNVTSYKWPRETWNLQIARDSLEPQNIAGMKNKVEEHSNHVGHQGHMTHKGHMAHQEHKGHMAHQEHKGHMAHQEHKGHMAHQGHKGHKHKEHEEHKEHHHEGWGWGHKEEGEGDTVDRLMGTIGPMLFPIPFFLWLVPFLIPAIPLSWYLNVQGGTLQVLGQAIPLPGVTATTPGFIEGYSLDVRPNITDN